MIAAKEWNHGVTPSLNTRATGKDTLTDAEVVDAAETLAMVGAVPGKIVEIVEIVHGKTVEIVEIVHGKTVGMAAAGVGDATEIDHHAAETKASPDLTATATEAANLPNPSVQYRE